MHIYFLYLPLIWAFSLSLIRTKFCEMYQSMGIGTFFKKKKKKQSHLLHLKITTMLKKVFSPLSLFHSYLFFLQECSGLFAQLSHQY